MKYCEIFTMLAIFLILPILFSMLYNNSFIEGYKNNSPLGRGYGIGGVGYDLNYAYKPIPNSNKIGNMRYPGKAFLSVADKPQNSTYTNLSDDIPSFFGFGN